MVAILVLDMISVISTSEKNDHFKSLLENNLIFNPKAVAIAILDRWGKAIWKKDRDESAGPIVWNGRDSFGCPVTSGSLLCKITYPDHQIIYVPFVFIQK